MVTSPQAAAPETTPAAPPQNRSRDSWAISILLLLTVVLWATRLHGPIDVRWDAGVYYVLGTSIYEGKGYRLLNEPGEIKAVQYPPLLPMIVAAHQWVTGDPSPASAGVLLRWTFAATTLIYVTLAYWVMRRWLAPPWACLGGAILVMHPWTLFMTDACFAEIPFGVVCMAFLLTHWAADRAAGTRRGRMLSAVAGVLGVIAFFLRTLGIALLAAWAGEALIRRRYKQAIFRGIVCIAPLLVWQGYVASVARSPDYTRVAYEYQRAPYLMYNVTYAQNMSLIDPFDPRKGPATLSGVAMRTWRNIRMLPSTLGEMVTALENFWERMIVKATKLQKPRSMIFTRRLMMAVGALVISGLIVLAVRREWLVVLLVGGTLGLICLTPWVDQFTRYLTPLIPIFAAALLLGVRTIHRFFVARGRIMRWVGNAGVAVLTVGMCVGTAFSLYRLHVTVAGPASYVRSDGSNGEQRLFFCESAWSDFSAALRWLREAANRHDIIATTAPHWTYLNTGLQAVQPPYENDPAEAQRLLDTVPATYFILDAFQYSGGDLSRRYVPPAIRDNPDLWEMVFETPPRAVGDTVRIYRRVHKEQP